ncbi:gephyrin-like molybdotransferase Glp [Methanobacterium alcaliphilum]|uniref:molybdenum cofactor synthesis domain-containing protein n=1 Tax=Methanobacterium alcaliphilum TaxID=392018 RepID=UPI00200A104C|nr:gephyrin-like molybdotransferase Glp [Methanobacterium alcaliphilum]MCK9150360.1 molybdopterin-binding protein [Methanobacterium alcaliphilum]
MVNEFLKIMELGDAEKIIKNLFDNFYSNKTSEKIDLLAANGRVLAEDVYATMDLPPFDRASKDGYAVISSDTFGATEQTAVPLNFLELIEAGEVPQKKVKKGFCSAINTGAPIPDGADAVVMVEYTEDNNGEIQIYRSAPAGQFITKKGNDITKGKLILKSGTPLTPDKIGVLSAMGLGEISVWKLPRVAVISTGKELVELDKQIEYGQIYDVNSYALESSLLSCGAVPVFGGIVKDNYESLSSSIKKALENSDIVLTSGSTSAGTGDVLKQVLDDMGEVLIHGISVKPGKPTMVGKIGQKIVIGLPGYPVAALMIFQIFIAPYLRKWSGMAQISTKTINALLDERFYSSKGRVHYALVKIKENKIYPILKDSGAITALAEADGYIKIPKNVEILTEGSKVNVFLF